MINYDKTCRFDMWVFCVAGENNKIKRIFTSGLSHLVIVSPSFFLVDKVDKFSS